MAGRMKATAGGIRARNSGKTTEAVAVSHSRPVIVAVDSDCHFGSVLSPVVRFEKKNGQLETPSKRQQHLADERARFVDDMAGLKAKLNAFMLYVNLGDITEGVKHKSAQRISEDTEDHVALAQLFMKPVVDVADMVVAIRGTEAHTGIGSTLEEAVWKPFADKVWKFDDEAGALTGYRAFIDVGGVRFDFEHHIAGAGRPWTKGGNIQRRAISAMFETSFAGEQPAHYVFRGHTHIAHDTGDNEPQPRGVICRTWKDKGDAFAHRIASEFNPALGAQYVIVNGPADHIFRWWKVREEAKKLWRVIDVPALGKGKR